MKRLLIALFLIIAVFSCKKDKPKIDTSDTAEFTSVKLESKNNSTIENDINFITKGDTIIALIPNLNDNKKLKISFETKVAGTIVKANNEIQISGTTVTDFTNPVTYTLTSPAGNSKSYKVVVQNFTGIPIFYLNTTDPIVSKDDYVQGTLQINANSLFDQKETQIALQAKGRGNSTWTAPKKPYRLKFNAKAEVLGLPAAKNWVLLANYADKTLLRTHIAFNLGHRLNADFTPRGRYIELVLNGEYVGSYYLTNQVEIHENRVNITEMSKGEITGGYLLEVDFRFAEDFRFKTKKDLPFVLKDPDELTPEQFEYIKKYIQETEDAIFSENFTDPVNGYAKYINVESFINWYLVQELTRNVDSQDQSSIFYYKDKNGKLGMGPIWDFDVSLGVAHGPVGWQPKGSKWFSRLFEDPAFRAKVKERWQIIKDPSVVYTDIDNTIKYINLSKEKNFERWKILNIDTSPIPNRGDYNAEVAFVKKWLSERFAWIDSEINKY